MDEKNINIAIRLACLFTEEIDLPGRLKEKENKKEKNINTQKNKENSGVDNAWSPMLPKPNPQSQRRAAQRPSPRSTQKHNQQTP
jgi:hypothetical protein